MNDERRYRPLSGWMPLTLCLALTIGSPMIFVLLAINRGGPTLATALLY